MKKIITSIVLLLLVLANFAHAQCEYCEEIPVTNTTSSFNYWNVGVGPALLIPNVGIGHRYYQDRFGYDVSLNLGSCYLVSYLQLNANALYIINPQAQRPFYLGLGAAVGVGTDFEFRGAALTVAPNFIFGKELTSEGCHRSFVEAQIQFPTFGWDARYTRRSARIDFPFVFVKYGRSF